MPYFVLEIGTEELPARFLQPAEKDLCGAFTEALQSNNLEFSSITTFSTPRRVVVCIEGVANGSPVEEVIVTGPAVKAAYDVGGRPTRAAEGFAKSNGIDVNDVFVQKTEKGEYIAVKKQAGGVKANEIFEKICPEIIAKLSFPKQMKWGSDDFTFARPLRWILSLLDSETIFFAVGGIQSGNTSQGHRIHGPGPFVVPNAQEFVRTIQEQGKIVLSGKERREYIIEQGNKLAAAEGGTVLWQDKLLDEVQGLVEHPVPLLASFNRDFLEIPQEVLLTSMQVHQKSFGIQANSGELLPYFLTVLNLTSADVGIVAKGWERVLRARLEDARFFWQTDLATKLDTWLESLETVIFLAPLGSMGDKSRRIAELSGWLANNIVSVDGASVHADDAIRAGRLSKADLVSEMVKEFDTLQGIMGKIYAVKQGESSIVADALAEQYLPSGPDTPVPTSMVGALISMADKADTLVGCFGLGMIPTGAADPYALRRAVLGITRILIEKNLRIDIPAFFHKAQELFGERAWKIAPEEALEKVMDFFSLRIKNYFITSGAETLYAEATIQADISDPWAAAKRLEALCKFSKTAQFDASVNTFKRVANIIKKQTEEGQTELTGEYVNELLRDQEEKNLAQAVESLTPQMQILWQEDNFTRMFEHLTELEPIVTAFFDGVMVMSEDVNIRQNRLNLLKSLLNNFAPLADFAALQM